MTKKFVIVLWLVTLSLTTPTQATPTTEHKLYFPFATTDIAPTCKRGLARASTLEGWHGDTMSRFGFCWFHDWNTSLSVPDPAGKIPHLPCTFDRIRTTTAIPAYNTANPLLQRAVVDLGADYRGYLIWLNEPNEPFTQCGFADGNHTLTLPELANEAADFYISTRQELPHAKLIAGNIFSPTPEYLIWFTLFREAVLAKTGAYPQVAGWGIHPYGQSLQAVQDVVNEACDMARQWGSEKIWVTEWGIDQHNPHAEQMVRDIATWLEANECVAYHAYYTNAQPWMADGIAVFMETDLYTAESGYTIPSTTGRALESLTP